MADASNLPARNLNQTHYAAAQKLFNEKDYTACIGLAEKNLENSTLPPHYVIENCLLIARALDDWRGAGIYIMIAECEYHTSREEAEKSQDVMALVVLDGLEEELVKVKDGWNERKAKVEEEEVGEDEDEDEDADTDMDISDDEGYDTS